MKLTFLHQPTDIGSNIIFRAPQHCFSKKIAKTPVKTQRGILLSGFQKRLYLSFELLNRFLDGWLFHDIRGLILLSDDEFLEHHSTTALGNTKKTLVKMLALTHAARQEDQLID